MSLFPLPIHIPPSSLSEAIQNHLTATQTVNMSSEIEREMGN